MKTPFIYNNGIWYVFRILQEYDNKKFALKSLYFL
tara:strand:- start:287 stop:391 length:105 start_codon:yes stop_codon:yes gene_type:complete